MLDGCISANRHSHRGTASATNDYANVVLYSAGHVAEDIHAGRHTNVRFIVGRPFPDRSPYLLQAIRTSLLARTTIVEQDRIKVLS